MRSQPEHWFSCLRGWSAWLALGEVSITFYPRPGADRGPHTSPWHRTHPPTVCAATARCGAGDARARSQPVGHGGEGVQVLPGPADDMQPFVAQASSRGASPWNTASPGSCPGRSRRLDLTRPSNSADRWRAPTATEVDATIAGRPSTTPPTAAQGREAPRGPARPGCGTPRRSRCGRRRTITRGRRDTRPALGPPHRLLQLGPVDEPSGQGRVPPRRLLERHRAREVDDGPRHARHRHPCAEGQFARVEWRGVHVHTGSAPAAGPSRACDVHSVERHPPHRELVQHRCRHVARDCLRELSSAACTTSVSGRRPRPGRPEQICAAPDGRQRAVTEELPTSPSIRRHTRRGELGEGSPAGLEPSGAAHLDRLWTHPPHPHARRHTSPKVCAAHRRCVRSGAQSGQPSTGSPTAASTAIAANRPHR